MIDLFGHKKEMRETLAVGLRDAAALGEKMGRARGLVAVAGFLEELRKEDMTALELRLRILVFIRGELEANP
ncbi:MAG TPA: hypothetical protein VM537_37090 [Anaerolineae bacterium]|nr:hypothetical protein [Anaerolineae bacterium]